MTNPLRRFALAALLLTPTACMTGRYEALPTMTFDQLAAPAPVKKLPLPDSAPPIEIAYVDEGRGPLIVLVHGLGEHLGYWSENLPDLVRRGHRVIAVDLPGFGRSSKPAADYSMSQQAGWLAAFLRLVAPDTPAVVVGHSMGGQIALRLALDAPELVSALCLLAPAGIERFSPGESTWIKENTGTIALARQDEDQIRAHYRKNLYGMWVPAAEHHLEERVRLRYTPDFEPYLFAVVRSIHAMLDGPVADALPKLPRTLPVVVAFGEVDAMIPNPFLHGGATADVADEAARLMPHARVHVLPELGHMLQVEAPERIDALIVQAVDAAAAVSR
ncbi:MAG: alpha/beta fold hydrolase [Bradymonadia bacterium]|jgi:pimeloyl-ACP methyl ester carboxylesterase